MKTYIYGMFDNEDNGEVVLGDWIKFVPRPKHEKRKTVIYAVRTKDGTVDLGEIRWYAPWRCYSFFPFPNTVFEKTCLRNVTEFIDRLMDARKKK